MNEKKDKVEVEIAHNATILNDSYNITFNDSENISQSTHTHTSLATYEKWKNINEKIKRKKEKIISQRKDREREIMIN